MPAQLVTFARATALSLLPLPGAVAQGRRCGHVFPIGRRCDDVSPPPDTCPGRTGGGGAPPLAPGRTDKVRPETRGRILPRGGRASTWTGWRILRVDTSAHGRSDWCVSWRRFQVGPKRRMCWTSARMEPGTSTAFVRLDRWNEGNRIRKHPCATSGAGRKACQPRVQGRNTDAQQWATMRPFTGVWNASFNLWTPGLVVIQATPPAPMGQGIVRSPRNPCCIPPPASVVL